MVRKCDQLNWISDGAKILPCSTGSRDSTGNLHDFSLLFHHFLPKTSRETEIHLHLYHAHDYYIFFQNRTANTHLNKSLESFEEKYPCNKISLN